MIDVGLLEADDQRAELGQPQPERHLALEHAALGMRVGAGFTLAGDHQHHARAVVLCAMKEMRERAVRRGLRHAVQVDADGQHDLRKLKALIEAALAQPGALVSGIPVFDASVPRSRLLLRWLTHVWVWVETLSTRIRDSMCGFRVYPLAAVMCKR